MFKRLKFLILLLLFSSKWIFAQDAGKIKGVVRDNETKETLPYATVKIFLNGIEKGAMNSDVNGEFSFSPVSPGTYDIEVSYSGQKTTIKGVLVGPGKTVIREIFVGAVVEVGTVEIVGEKLIEADQVSTGGTLTKQDIDKLASRSISSNIATTAGIVQKDDQQGFNVRGARAEGQEYFVDGVRVSGRTALPRAAISQLSVITGGTPAEYGDATGGIIQITTAAPSSEHTGSVEAITSQVFDRYGYNLIAVSGSGPLISKKDSTGKIINTKLGYFAGFELESQKDDSPSAVGIYKVKPDVLKDLKENPLTTSPDGTFFINRANYLTKKDIINEKWKDGAMNRAIRANVRLDYQVGKNTFIKIGANYDNTNRRIWSLTNSLLAQEAFERRKDYTARGYIRFQQVFQDSGAFIKNLYYSIQADYQVFNQNRMDDRHRDKIFNYGHYGKFTSHFAEILFPIQPGTEFHDPSISQSAYLGTIGFTDTSYVFDGSNSSNPIMANYLENIYSYLRNNPRQVFDFTTFTYRNTNTVLSQTDLLILGGIRNGDAPQNIYSLYNPQGTVFGFYTKFNEQMYRLTGQATAEIGDHNIKFGFEFQQRTERYWGISSRAIWSIMRQLANKHLTTIDYDNPHPVYVNGVFQGIVHYDRKYEETGQSNFDKNLRQALGLPINGTDYIQIDALDPSTFSLNMFNADELLNNGSSFVTYYGYDFRGNRVSKKPDSEFFTNKELRNQNAYSPSYIAVYLQDKFEVNKMIFNIGVRVDRFDANQKVLKDKYIMRDFYNAGEAAKLLGVSLPSNINPNWAPYVDNINNPSRIIGYRDGSTWYDASGNPVDPKLLATGGKVQPYIKSDTLSIDAFTDYKPQINIMPRISFSFPISDEALFFAHYDVLTQRPKAAQVGQFTNYLYINQNATESITNPDLKPETTIDYEAGFKQALGDKMALTLSAFYREMRNMIQILRNNYAYPITYDSYENLDFATVKGFSGTIETRRIGPLKMRASYTLQFASGTGSSFNSSRATLGSIEGFAVLRTLLPLSFDQRHTFTGNVDFRFTGDQVKPGKYLNGPGFGGNDSTGKRIYPLKNFGANLTFNLGSGTPYTRNSLPNTADVQFGINPNNQTAGTPMGSRLPFNIRFDLRLDKDFFFGGKEKVNEETGQKSKTREYSLNVHIICLNLLNTKNVIGVYTYSGLPDNNGFLQSAVGQQTISTQFSPASFVDLYTIKSNSPFNFSLPRRLRLGMIFNF